MPRKALVPLDMGGQKITAVADPSTAQEAATKGYVDAQVATGQGGSVSLSTRLKWEVLLR